VAENLRIAAATFISSWIWITVISLFALALSAWVKWKPVAGFLMFLVPLTGAFFGNLAGVLFRIDEANAINLGVSMRTVWRSLFGLDPGTGVPVYLAWLALLGLAAVCLFLLHRKVRAYEVVS
jgi:ABC-2 type transport system permease protein